jgi:peptide subunit release factor 1 (eRF1)
MIALLTGIVGLATTILAWYLNPRRQLYDEIDRTYRELEENYVKRDKALADNDSDALTAATAAIVRLCQIKNCLLQRLGQGIQWGGKCTTTNPDV